MAGRSDAQLSESAAILSLVNPTADVSHVFVEAELSHALAPSTMPISSSRDDRQHSLPAGNVLHAPGRMG